VLAREDLQVPEPQEDGGDDRDQDRARDRDPKAEARAETGREIVGAVRPMEVQGLSRLGC
jgi:hypothetical protein